ncbi:hypothetical protein KKE06_05170 [Candidatus Micrarchaeota archaeon]|nr:hypothetical protein [Candidatus Micrarchaeota archaeon]MBU1930201.1 hypothetical protein [Candidatus Micrarchaeota archaeon]
MKEKEPRIIGFIEWATRLVSAIAAIAFLWIVWSIVLVVLVSIFGDPFVEGSQQLSSTGIVLAIVSLIPGIMGLPWFYKKFKNWAFKKPVIDFP